MISEIIAGKSKKGSRVRPWWVAYGEAALILNTGEVSLVYQVVKSEVWWLACRSADGKAETVLGSALPGHKGHKGPGIYFPALEPGVEGAGCAFTGDSLRVSNGDSDSMEAWAKELGLTVINPTASQPWHSHEELARGEERSLWRGVSSLGVALLVAAGSFFWTAAHQKAEFDAAQVAPAEQAKGDVSAKMLRMGLVTGLATSGEGALYRYEYQSGQEKVRMLVSGEETRVKAMLPKAKVVLNDNGTGSTVEMGE